MKTLLTSGCTNQRGAGHAELALDLMLRYPRKIKAIEADNPDIRLLQQLVEQRRLLVEDKRRFVNRLINTLKQYYPSPWNGSPIGTAHCSAS
jgi:predicted RNA methylase